MVDNFEIGLDKVRVGAVHFNKRATLSFTLDQFNNNADVSSAIDAITSPGGKTNLADAMRKTRNELLVSPGDRTDAPNICVLYTDGIPDRETDATDNEVNLLKMNCTLITVSIGSNTDKSQLRNISSENRSFETLNFDLLRLIEANLTETICEVPEGKKNLCFVSFVSSWLAAIVPGLTGGFLVDSKYHRFIMIYRKFPNSCKKYQHPVEEDENECQIQYL